MPGVGWKLDRGERDRLLERLPAEWPDVVADHVTLGAQKDRDPPLPMATRGAIVGSVNDGQGLQAMVVAIDGTTHRPDDSTYHITWSLDRARGREAVESNRVIAERGWQTFDNPIPIRLIPARLG